jgi:prepilin-type N-terminal cleavage/methylation domain-containing protein
MSKKKTNYNKGFSLLEVILAAALFSVFSAPAISFSLRALQGQRQSEQAQIAMMYASEGIEAIRSIRDGSFDNLSNTQSSGLNFSGGSWSLQGEDDEIDGYRRSISVSSARRDGDGNIILDSGQEDEDMKRIVSTVTWTSPSGKEASINLVTYIARWR